MRMPRARTNSAVSGDIVASFVRNIVRAYRGQGHKRDYGLYQAALALDITPRYARGLYKGEVRLVPAERYDQIKRRFMRHLDDEAARLLTKHDEVIALRKQMEMSL